MARQGQEFQGGPLGSFKIEKLEADIDTRMLELWREASSTPDDDWNLVVAARFMRAAYGKGYCDALSEIEADRGQLAIEHGYGVPTPKPQIFPDCEQL